MKLTIYRKMVLGFGLVISIMVGANLYMLFELHSVSKAARTTLASNVRAIDLAKRLQSLLYEGELNAQKYLITRDGIYYDLFEEAGRQFREDADALAEMKTTDPETMRIAHQVRQRHEELWQSLAEARNAGRAPGLVQKATSDNSRKETVDFLDRTLDHLIRLNQISIDGSMAVLAGVTRRFSGVAALITLLTLLAASAAAWIITRTLTRPLSQVINATQQIANGSFEPIHISARDEMALLADAVNEMSRRLKKMNDLKSDLMHQIVHELRTPVQIIFSAQGILAEQKLGGVNQKQLEMLHLIRSNVEKLLRFTDQFLDLARIEAGVMKYRLSPTDLRSVVSSVLENAKPLASQKDIALKLSANPVPLVLADSGKLAQVFTNLLSNAIKYTPRGGSIEVTISSLDESVRVAVKDSGAGIPAEDLPKLFTKFYQASNASKASGTGTGLGLALVKALVEGHGGRISVESELGIGSVFTVELPPAREGEALEKTQDAYAEPALTHDEA